MSKTKEYRSDVQQKIVDHHKTESGCKTITKELKIPILTPFSSSSRTHWKTYSMLCVLYTYTCLVSFKMSQCSC